VWQELLPGPRESKGTVRAISDTFNLWLGQVFVKGFALAGNSVA
jgi:hypothetical protein